MSEDRGIGPGAPGEFTIELFVPWIYKLMLTYQDQKESENEILIPQGIKYSKAYYTKKVN